MDQFILDISKYLIAFFMIIYTFECFSIFRSNSKAHKNGIYIRQIIVMFMVHFLCFMSIYLYTKDLIYLFFYAFQVIAVVAIIIISRQTYPDINRFVVNNMCMLLMIGFIMLTRINMAKAEKQCVIVLFAMLFALLIPFLIRKIKELKGLHWLYAGIGILALSIVYLFGAATNGSKISMKIYGIAFQPSEIVKILFVFFLASLFYEAKNFKNLVISAAIASLHIVILVLSRDLGSALIFAVVYVVVLFIASGKIRYLIGGVIGAAFSCIVAYQLFSHVRVRVQSWIDPWKNIDGGGYQITQSLFAIGSGRWIGSGLFRGTPESIPYVDTDFIFSAISEEMGLIFSICVILIYLSTFIMFIKISIKTKNQFYKLTTCGLAIIYIFQIFLTIGGGTKFIPLTGVTLPLISYGGTSVIVTIILFSVFQGIHLLNEAGNGKDTDQQQIHKQDRNLDSDVSVKTIQNLENDGNEQDESIIKDNKHISFVMYFFIGIFVFLIGYLIYFIQIESPKILDNDYNGRQELLEQINIRGNIYSADGQILAQTQVDDAGNKTRSYPYSEVFAHVVGFSTKGRSGLEDMANYYLVRSSISELNKLQNDLNEKMDPADNIVTTLNTTLQQAAYDALGDEKGAVIAMNPQTGQIYAMVSKPDFDPNQIDSIWDDLIAEDSADNTKGNGVLVNRATQGVYPPGSVFKILTALEYLKEYNNDISNYTFDCTGKFEYKGSVIDCYHNKSHGVVDFTQSFAKSCNSSFANIGLMLDMDKFSKTLEECMFNETLPLNMSYKKSQCLVTSKSTTDEILQSVIGQGETLVTPMHMAMITAAIANQGVVMKPYLIDYIETANKTVIKQYKKSEYRQIMTTEESTILKQLMLAVVEDGTATKLSGQDYTAAGKTGSAEYTSGKESHAWFTGFAPYDNPEIVVTVVVEGGGIGGEAAVPIAKEVMDAYFSLAP